MKIRILIFISSFFFTSCFELQETLQVMADGKGDYSFTFDFSESKAMMEIITAYRTTEGAAIFQASKFKEPLSLISNDLNGIPGVYDCKEIVDTLNWKLGMKFAFVDVNALNSALNKIDGNEEVQYLKMKRKKAEWTQNINWLSILNANIPLSEEAKDAFSLSIDSAKYYFDWQLNREIKTIKSFDIEQIGSSQVSYEGTIPKGDDYEYITQWNIKFKK